MNANHLFVALAAASLVAAMTLAPVLASAVEAITSATSSVSDDAATVKIQTAGKVYKGGQDGAFGYGFATAETFIDSTVAVTTTHKGVYDSEKQSGADDPVFHNHYVRLGTGNANCTGSGNADGLHVVDITFEEPGKAKVWSNTNVNMENVPQHFEATHSLTGGDLTFDVTDPLAPVAFELSVPTGNPFDGVCVNNVQIGAFD